MFSVLLRYGIWIAVPLMTFGLFLIVFCILKVIRVVKDAHVLSLPLVESQEIEFTAAGRLILFLEGPQFTTRFARLGYELRDTVGAPVASRRIWLRTKISGFSKVRLAVRTFDIPAPGRYVLNIENFGGFRERDTEHGLVFMRPFLRALIACVLGIVAGAGLFISNLVLFILRLASSGTDM